MSAIADNMLTVLQDDTTDIRNENALNQVGSRLVSFIGNLFAVRPRKYKFTETNKGWLCS